MMTRTTIRLPDPLLQELKQRALKAGKSFAAEVEDVIRIGLKQAKVKGRPVDLPVFKGGGGVRPGVDLNDTSELLALTEKNAAV